MGHVRSDLALEFYEMDNELRNSKAELNVGGYSRRFFLESRPHRKKFMIV